MMNRWTLTDEIRIEFTPIIQEFINKLEELDSKNATELLEINLSDTKLNPSRLIDLLIELGYEKGEQNESGWQWDFWIPMTKDGFKTLTVGGTGYIFELILSEMD